MEEEAELGLYINNNNQECSGSGHSFKRSKLSQILQEVWPDSLG